MQSCISALWFRRIYACLHSSIFTKIKDENHIAQPAGTSLPLECVIAHLRHRSIE